MKPDFIHLLIFLRKTYFQHALWLGYFFIAQDVAAQRSNFNNGWEFIGQEFVSKEKVDSTRKLGDRWDDQFLTEQVNTNDTAFKPSIKELQTQLAQIEKGKWQQVTLPHTAFPEPLVIVKAREGIAWYKKTFQLDKFTKGQSVTLYFEGAMQVADVWLNGEYITRHTGGYLPFVVDIGKKARFTGENTIYVRLDNRAHPLVPPGKPVQKLDFIYYSGIYRSVWLDIKRPLHITDAVAADKKAGGGIFVTYPEVKKDLAIVAVQSHITNEYNQAQVFQVEQRLVDAKGNVVSRSVTDKKKLEGLSDEHYQQQLMVKQPALWHPDHPHLYQLHTLVTQNGKVTHKTITPIGIRSFEITKDKGLLINGTPFKIAGTNRHQNYPYVGNALLDNANYRDAWLIKNAGMNCVRTGHYPPDPSFMKAADELGLLIVTCTPGWQFYNRASGFTDHVMNDIREMIRRDRNHPSVLLWETSLNEAYPPAAFRCKQAEVAKSEWLGNKNFFTSGDSYFVKACWDVPYDDWNGDPGARNNTTYPGTPFLIREYGDYEFGGGSSTSRQVRGSGQDALLQQAWNLQWEHNKNQKNYPRAIGDLTWAFYDGLAGLMVGIEGWGVADIFRIPKFSYYFFQSQRNSRVSHTNGFTGPVATIAHYWQQDNQWKTVSVYSNCEEVFLYLNNKLIAKQKPDSGGETDYGTRLDKGGKPFDGGNANHLQYPPFTFQHITFAPGTIKAVGYIKGKKVALDSVSTAGEPAQIQLQIAENGRPLKKGTEDLVFVYAKVADASGRLVTNADHEITLHIKGEASLVSPATVKAEAGIASFLLRTNELSKSISLKAESSSLKTQQHIVL